MDVIDYLTEIQTAREHATALGGADMPPDQAAVLDRIDQLFDDLAALVKMEQEAAE
jgi:hypothetical protein